MFDSRHLIFVEPIHVSSHRWISLQLAARSSKKSLKPAPKYPKGKQAKQAACTSAYSSFQLQISQVSKLSKFLSFLLPLVAVSLPKALRPKPGSQIPRRCHRDATEMPSALTGSRGASDRSLKDVWSLEVWRNLTLNFWSCLLKSSKRSSDLCWFVSSVFSRFRLWEHVGTLNSTFRTYELPGGVKCKECKECKASAALLGDLRSWLSAQQSYTLSFSSPKRSKVPNGQPRRRDELAQHAWNWDELTFWKDLAPDLRPLRRALKEVVLCCAAFWVQHSLGFTIVGQFDR